LKTATEMLTTEERDVWRAAYGAAMAVAYVKAEEPARLAGQNETALLLGAEVGIAAGDVAVRALRRWRADEDAGAGIALMSWSEA
jgi:hypothetical protein